MTIASGFKLLPQKLYLRSCIDSRTAYEVDDQTFFRFCFEITFNENSYHIETSRLICFVNQWTSSYMIRVFNDSRFRADYKYKQINYVTVISEAVIQRLSEIIQKNSQKMSVKFSVQCSKVMVYPY